MIHFSRLEHRMSLWRSLIPNRFFIVTDEEGFCSNVDESSSTHKRLCCRKCYICLVVTEGRLGCRREVKPIPRRTM